MFVSGYVVRLDEVQIIVEKGIVVDEKGVFMGLYLSQWWWCRCGNALFTK